MLLLHDALDEHAARSPQRPALIEAGARVSYAELDRRTRAIAAALQRQGIAPGDRVIVLTENTIDAATSMWSVFRAGGVVVPLGVESRPARVDRIVEDCRPAAVLGRDEALSALGQAIAAAPRPRLLSLSALTAEPARALSAVSLIDQDLATIIYTSGTSGESKGVMLTHRNLVNTSAAIVSYLGQTLDDVTCCVLPLAFSYGMFQLFAAMQVGSTVLLERSFAFPFDVLRRVQEERATMFPAVPTVFAKLIQMAPVQGLDLASLRIMTNAAAAIPPAHLLRLQQAFPSVAIYPMYGQTECTRASYLHPSLVVSAPSSVGRAIPNCELHLIDESGTRLPLGSEGELVVCGANVMRGYWGRPDATSDALLTDPTTGERMLRTRDRFRQDADGLLYFVSRSDDIFKCRGEKVAPSLIEHALCEMPEVAEAAVVGVDDPNDGMAIKAIVVPRPGSDLTEARIRQHCKATLESVFMPRFVELRDSLPKTDSGKLRRRDLVEGRATS